MLKIKEVEDKNVYEEYFEVDYYVPFTIRFDTLKNKASDIMIHEIFNNNSDRSSMIELETDLESGKLFELCLLNVDKLQEVESGFLEDTETVRIGSVSVEKDLRHVVKKINSVDLVFDYKNLLNKKERKFYIIFNENTKEILKISEHFSVLINKNAEISGFLISNFSDKEWSDFLESLVNKLEH